MCFSSCLAKHLRWRASTRDLKRFSLISIVCNLIHCCRFLGNSRNIVDPVRPDTADRRPSASRPSLMQLTCSCHVTTPWGLMPRIIKSSAAESTLNDRRHQLESNHLCRQPASPAPIRQRANTQTRESGSSPKPRAKAHVLGTF